MKLSVLIPMYNASDYIVNCLESLVNNDLSPYDYEVIILDDGSTDNSFEITKKHIEFYDNFRLFSHKNKGESSSRNKLLEMAKGEYVYNLDADDYVVHNSLKLILDKATEYNADMIGFNTLLTHSLENKLLFHNDKEIKVQTGIDYLNENRNFRVEVWWYLIKNSFLKETHIRFGKNKFNADVVFTLSLILMAKQFVFYPISVHRYVQSKNSITRNDDLLKKKIGVENMKAMIIDYSNLINIIILKNNCKKENIIKNLKFRRDAFLVFTIIKMIRYQIGFDRIKENICALEKVKAYPINNFIGIEYNSLKYKFLVKLINNKAILLLIAKVYYLYKKINR